MGLKMNLFLWELRSHRKGLFFWCLGMVALVGSGMAKYAAYQTAGQSITGLLAQFPKTLQIIFGLSGFDLTKASGFFGVLFLYIALMATVHAVLLGADLISKEERDKTSEFLFVKPISRAKIITSKLLAGLVNLVILNIVTLVSSIVFVNYFNKGGSITNDVLVLMAGLVFLQLLFFCIGVAIAAANKKPKASASLASSVLLFTFILSFLINFNARLNGLKYITPFKYFDAKTLITNGSLDPVYVSISLVIIAVLVVITYSTYLKRDLSV
jgi:ABC-2 type transport system permease protein